MRFFRYEKPVVVEQLRFRLNPEKIEEYIELDNEIWTRNLSQYPGFLGKEVWLNETRKDEIDIIIYWESHELWQAISHEVLERLEKQMLQAIGEHNFELIDELHKKNQFVKIAEYTNGNGLGEKS